MPSAKRINTIIARRQDLIRGTIESIAAVGYHNSTVQSICEAAGLSRGLIGHYFKGKEDLLMEAFRYLTEQLGEETRKAIRAVGPDPYQRLLAVASVTFREPTLSPGQAPVWLAFWGVARWNPEMLALHRQLWRSYRAWIERLMAAAAADRGLEIDAKRAALTFTQMIDGFWFGWIMDDEAYSPKDAETILHDWLMDLFGEGKTSPRPKANGRASAPGRKGAGGKTPRTAARRTAAAARSGTKQQSKEV